MSTRWLDRVDPGGGLYMDSTASPPGHPLTHTSLSQRTHITGVQYCHGSDMYKHHIGHHKVY